MSTSGIKQPTPQEKRKLRKLTLRLKHLTEEHDEAQVLKSEYEVEFQQMAGKLRVALGIDEEQPEEKKGEPAPVSQNYNEHFKAQPPPNAPSPEDKTKEVEEEVRKEIENTANSADPWMKRVYKQIAMETHPDKVNMRDDLSIFEQAQRVGMFSKARKALVDQDGPTLLQLAEELSLNAEVDPGMKINMLNSKISTLSVEVKKIYRTPSWIWGESYGNQNIRLKLLEGYCRILKYQVPSREFLSNFITSVDGTGNSGE